MKTKDIVNLFALDEDSPRSFRDLALLAAEEFDQTGRFGPFDSQTKFLEEVFQFRHMDLIKKLAKPGSAQVELAQGQRIYELLREQFGRPTCMTGYNARFGRLYVFSPVHRLLCLSIDSHQARRFAILLDNDHWFLETVYSSTKVLNVFMGKNDPLNVTKPLVRLMLSPTIYRSKKDQRAFSSTFLLQYPLKYLHRTPKGRVIPLPFHDTFSYWVIVPIGTVGSAYHAVVQMHNNTAAAMEAHARIVRDVCAQAEFTSCHITRKKFYICQSDCSNGIALTAAVKQIGQNVCSEINRKEKHDED